VIRNAVVAGTIPIGLAGRMRILILVFISVAAQAMLNLIWIYFRPL
jgi:hypothetical protein